MPETDDAAGPPDRTEFVRYAVARFDGAAEIAAFWAVVATIADYRRELRREGNREADRAVGEAATRAWARLTGEGR